MKRAFILLLAVTMAFAQNEPDGSSQGYAAVVNRKSGLVLTNDNDLAYQYHSDPSSSDTQWFEIYYNSDGYAFYDSNEDVALHAPNSVSTAQLEFDTYNSGDDDEYRWDVVNEYGDFYQFKNNYNHYAINVRAGSLNQAVVNQYQVISSWPRQYWALIYVNL